MLEKLPNVTTEEQVLKLQNLYDYFKMVSYAPISEDLSFQKTPDNDDENPYICCEQKIIHWDGERYLITSLYNSHPTLEYATKNEVIQLYFGYKSSLGLDLRNESGDPEDKSYNDGIVLFHREIVGEGSQLGINFAKAFSKRQIIIN